MSMLFDSFDGKSTLLDEFTGSVVSSDVEIVEVLIINPISVLNQDEKHELIVKVVPMNANNSNIVWESSRPDVASISIIDDNVVITGISSGVATIKAIAEANPNIYDSFIVTVGVPTTGFISISIINKPSTIDIGESIQLEALISSSPQIESSVLWSTNAPESFDISANGLLTTRGIGSGRIYATVDIDKSISDSFYLSVNDKINLKSIDITNKIGFIQKGKSYQFQNSVSPSGTTDKSVVWSSDSPSVIAISSSTGFATALSIGNASIKCQSMYDPNIYDIVIVGVYESITGIKITPKPLSLNAGDVIQLNVELEGVSSGMAPVVLWQTSNALIGEIDQNGLLRIRS